MGKVMKGAAVASPPHWKKTVVESTNPHGDCYCGLWEKSPQTLIDQGVPEGYCGLCSVSGCGRPGHIRHYPGPVPVTLCWCDEHYAAEVSGFNPIRLMTNLVFLGLVIFLAWFVYSWLI